MRRPREPGGRLLRAAALLTLLPVASLSAQGLQGPQRVVAYLKGLQTGLCVEFLVAPSAVAEHFGDGVLPVPVESLAGRHPALARVAIDEPAYHAWTPATYCWFLYREVVVNGRTGTQDGGRQPVGVGYLGLAASGLPDSADQVVVTFFTNSGRIAGALERARIRVDQIDLTRALIPGEEEDSVRRRFTARHGRTTIQWDGGPGVPGVPVTQQFRLLSRASTGGRIPIRSSITPDSAWAPSGTLKVMGKGKVLQLLAASPIRLVTTYYRGGDSDWEFGR